LETLGKGVPVICQERGCAGLAEFIPAGAQVSVAALVHQGLTRCGGAVSLGKVWSPAWEGV